MKPVLVLQHLHGDGPAYLGTWLQRAGVAHVVRNSEAGEGFPASIDGFGALAVLGGAMSANDPLPSLRRAEALILDAMARDLPVLGHCLGGQLMARALGARVAASPAPEIGWQPLTVADDPLAIEWFGSAGEQHVFHWHEEAFDLPTGALALATSAACRHQAFAFGRHLAMQFHVEVDEEKVHRWSHEDTPQYREAQERHATVQSGSQMREASSTLLKRQQALADRIYARWLGFAATRA